MSGTIVTTKEGVKPEIGFLGKIGGRKFILAIVGVIAVALHKQFSWIDSNDVMTIGGIVATYIVGQSISDGMTGGATSTTTPVSDPAEVVRINAAVEAAKMGTALAENGDSAQDIGAAIDKLAK